MTAVKNQLSALTRRMVLFLKHKINTLDANLRNNMRLLTDLDKMFENMELRLNLSKTYLHQEIRHNLSYKEIRFHDLLQKLEVQSPLAKLDLREQKLKLLLSRLIYQIQTRLNEKEAEFTHATAVLNSVSPLATLARGYSIVTKLNTLNQKKEIISNASDTTKGDNLEILLHRGVIQCTVSKVP